MTLPVREFTYPVLVFIFDNPERIHEARNNFATVLIYISEVDPCFEVQVNDRYEVREDLPLSSIIFSLAYPLISPPISPSIVQISVSSTGQVINPHPFSLVNDSIFLVSALDYENIAGYEISILFSNSRPMCDITRTVTIQVMDLNDVTPTIQQINTTYVEENTPQMISFIASDLDFLPLMYSVSGVPSSQFMFPDTLQPTLAVSSLDRESRSSYLVTIIVRDSGVPSLSSFINFLVIVTDQNDNTPRFNQTHYVGAIPENQVGRVVTINAVDIDSGSNSDIVFTLANFLTPLFTIETVQLSDGYFEGRINLTTALDYESQQRVHSFLVQAEDRAASAGERLSSTTNVTIYILDVNDITPSFVNEPYAVTVNEELPINDTLFSQVIVSDPEEGVNGEVVFLQNSTSLLSVDPDTGVITVSGRLDREDTDLISVTLYVFDMGVPSLTATTTFSLTLLDINDNPPIFIESPIYRIFPENTMTNSILLNLSILTTDADVGGSSTHSYSLQSVSSRFDVSQTFEIMSDLLVLRGLFDFESDVYSYEFRICANDGVNTDCVSAVINITDINDNAPEFNFPVYNFNISENNPMVTFIGLVSAIDADSGINRKIDYSLMQNETRFSITSNGTIWSNFIFDREATPTVNFVVTATDRGSPRMSDSATVIIDILDVIDVTPRFVGGPFNLPIPENINTSSSIFSFMIIDPDIEPPPILTLSGFGSEDFRLSGNTLYADSPLDRDEGQSLYQLTIVANDSAGLTAMETLTIALMDVNDNAAEFEEDVYGFMIIEERAPIFNLGRVTAVDIDFGDNAKFQYFIKEGKELFGRIFSRSTDCVFSGTSGNVFGFSINRENGSLSLNSTVDYESVHFFSLSVCTSNVAPPFQERCVCVIISVQNINDVPPEFFPDEISMNISETAGTLADTSRLVTSTSFTDLDGFASDSYSMEVRHSYGSQFPFALSPTNTSLKEPDGSIQITRTILTASNVDREVRDSYFFQVCVFDGTFTDCAQISLTILDVNDNPPIFGLAFIYLSVQEHVPVGFQIDIINATDADINRNSVIEYRLVNGTEYFSVHPSTGVLSVAADIDRDPNNNTVTVLVQASNLVPGVPVDFGVISAVVYIDIRDINDNVPQYRGPLSASLREDVLDQIIFSVTATDADIGENARLSFTIIRDPDDSFTVDMHGVVRNRRYLDRDVRTGGKLNYYFTLLVADNGIYPSSLNVSFNFSVTALNVNDHVPSIEGVRSFDIVENMPPNFCLGMLTVDDLDFPDNTTVVIEFATNSEFFSINQSSGEICSRVLFDRESRSAYSVEIILIDLQSPVRNTTETISVSIGDENDNPPSWVSSCPIYVQDSIMRSGSRVATLDANDPDLTPSLIYRIVGSDFGFSLIGSDLYPPSGADVSDTLKYWLAFSVHDSVHVPVILDCTILVTDQNSYDPVLSPSQYSVTVIEDIPVNYVLLTVSAVDLDEGINGNISFELLNGDNVFSLDNDGEINFRFEFSYIFIALLDAFNLLRHFKRRATSGCPTQL